MLVTTARSAHCQRCANCSRQYNTEDCILDSTKNKRKTRQDSEAHTRHQTTDHFATYRMIEQKCHEWRIKMWTATIDFTKAFDSITYKSFWKSLKSCNIKHDHISLLKKIYRDQKASGQTDEESNMFEIKKGTKQGDPLSRLLFNTVLQNSLKDDIPRRQKKKRMGIYLSDHEHDCLTNLRFADDVLLFACSEEQLQKMLCEFKKSTGKVGLRIHPEETQILSNQSTLKSDTKKRNGSRWHWNRNTDKRRKREILGPDDYVPATGDARNQESNQGCLGDTPQVQAGADIEKLHAQTSPPAVRRSDNSDDMLPICNMGTHQRARRSRTKKSRPTKKKTPTIWATKARTDKAPTLTKTRTVTCRSRTILKKRLILQRLKKDYIKGSTNEAIEKMGNEKNRCWNKTHKKMKWRQALRIATSPSERWLIKAAEWNPELNSKYRTNRAIGRPRKRLEDDINEFLKLVEDETENLTESSNQINKTWINTAEDHRRLALLEENYTMTSEERREKMREREEILMTDQRGMTTVWGWAKKMWSTSHNTKWKKNDQHKKRKCRSLKAAGAPHSAPHAVHQREFGNQQQLRNQEHVDGWIHESFVATGKLASTKTEDIEYRHPWLNARWKDYRSDWWAELLAFLFLWCPIVCSGSSCYLALGFLRCVAQNPRIQLTLNWIQRVQCSYACVVFFQPLALLIEIRRSAHSHLTVCKCTPCQQRKSHLL